MSKIEYMKVIATSLSPFPNLFRDLKNNLTVGKFVWFFMYCIYALYVGQIADRVIGLGHLNTLVAMFYIQEFPILLFVSFYLKKIYLKIIESKRIEVDKIKSLDNSSRHIWLFRIFLFSALIFYCLLIFLNLSQPFFLYFVIKLFLLGALILLPSFILIEKPNISYFLSLKVIVKAIRLQFFKLLLITFITTIIFEMICIPLYYFPQGYVTYKVVISNGEDVTTGILFAVSAVCNFITVYIGMIIYTKLSIDIYLKFKKRILYELTKVNNTLY